VVPVVNPLDRPLIFGDVEQIQAVKELARQKEYEALPECRLCSGKGMHMRRIWKVTLNGVSSELSEVTCYSCMGTGKLRRSLIAFYKRHGLEEGELRVI
jgi:DnaJ-class molecular chaperone